MDNARSIHGNDNRGLAAGANPGIKFGRFGTMFDAPPAGKLPDEGLRALAEAMIKKDDGKPITDPEPVDENPAIPAGYTYFGQFIDHDITFDPTPLNASSIDPSALVDFRSPALDLDNLYGRGPDDQPYMYEADGLRVGPAPGAADAITGTKADLFRLADGTPILGDKRNDENKLVSQFHGAMIQLHNKVVANDDLITAYGGDLSSPTSRFRSAANLVRWHYQYVVVFDYLRHVCLPGVLTEVLNWGGTPRLPNYLKLDADFAYMPVEFSRRRIPFRALDDQAELRPEHDRDRSEGEGPEAHPGPDVQPQRGRHAEPQRVPGPLAPSWGLDFGFFLDMPAGAKAKEGGFVIPQPSYRIDALLTGPLQDLPEFFKQTNTPRSSRRSSATSPSGTCSVARASACLPARPWLGCWERPR